MKRIFNPIGLKRLPISEDVNMNDRIIINCNEGINDNDVCIIKHLTVYYKKGLTLNISN